MCESCQSTNIAVKGICKDVSVILSKLITIENHLSELNGKVATNVGKIHENETRLAVAEKCLEINTKGQQRLLDNQDKQEDKFFSEVIRKHGTTVTIVLILGKIIVDIILGTN